MVQSFQVNAKVRVAAILSSALALWFTFVSLASAHEVFPTIVDMEHDGEVLTFTVGAETGANLEAFVSGIDLSAVIDTDDASEAELYDELRAQDSATFEAAVRDYWPTLADKIDVRAGDARLSPELVSVSIPEPGNVDVIRESQLVFQTTLPEGAEAVTVGWDGSLGGLVLRQQGVDAPYDGFLVNGDTSPEITLAGGSQLGGWATFFSYIPTGFDHIVPKGLDHILFVLGIFFLSTKLRPLVWQISLFTVAHTITLALAALGYTEFMEVWFQNTFEELEFIQVVEVLIAASIVYVAFENLFQTGLSPWRPFIVFGFGLLHGLGFASVLAEFGLPESSFIPALIGFNIGVEIGQLAVVAIAFIIVKKAIDFDRTDQASQSMAAVFLGLMILTIAMIVPIDVYGWTGDLLPVMATVAILFGLSAAAIATPRYDNYREMVAMPASILIATVAAYWCFERAFL